ncbi:hypothetical protein F4802DRAFT_559319 [Xylaria palmicola]|nr:hypothetical protein F4802DRAFT_559319 [Xylaria palmicola]
MMHRNLPETGSVLTTKPNGRKTNTQPLGNRRLSGKGPGNPEWKENSVASDPDRAGGVRSIHRPTPSSIPRRRPSDSLIQHRLGSLSPSPSPSARVDRSTTPFGTPRISRSTRIPRPATAGPIADSHLNIPLTQDRFPDDSSDHSSPMRQPMDLRAAFRRAQEQTAAEEFTDSDNTLDLHQAFGIANAEFNAIRGIDGSPSPAPRASRREFKSSIPAKSGASVKGNDLNKHLQQFDRNHHLTSGDGPLEGLFSKNNAGPTGLGASRTLAKKTSNSSLSDHPQRQRPHFGVSSPENPGKVKANGAPTEKLPASGVVTSGVDADMPVPSIEYEYPSDERASPNFRPLNLSPDKSMNWHLDADFTAGDLQVSESPRIMLGKNGTTTSRTTSTPVTGRMNDRLGQIHQREAEAARATFPDDTSVAKQMNHKLEEIRIREMEALSRRAVASSRLDEIRLKNSELRSESPEIRKDPYNTFPEAIPINPGTKPPDVLKPTPSSEAEGEVIRDTPIVVFKNLGDRMLPTGDGDRVQKNDDKRGALSRGDSHDLLRRLARATSSSPEEQYKKTEQGKIKSTTEKTGAKESSEPQSVDRPVLPQERKIRNLDAKNSRDRLSVGFADLTRALPSDSAEEKRSSRPTSEIDPTDRIAAELNLFAPLDNYSEKGSNRAPSPVLPEPVDEETPRPPKIDPLTQPTPRVTGAYVDTPVTVRVKRDEGRAPMSAKPRGLSNSLSPTKQSTNAHTNVRERSHSMPTTSRRSRSSSKQRRPLINTAKPPTVREDIKAILRANQIDDSTLENLDSILTDQEVDDKELKQIVNDAVLKVEDDLDIKFAETSDRERELEAFGRMSKSLQTGLLGIRSAKKGIERLEDKVTLKGGRDDRGVASTRDKPSPPSSSSEASAPVLIPLPRLYHRKPKFRLTKLGIFTMCAFIWYILECTFCFLYAGPEYICTPSVPCDWSPNEPYFPYTMPFMLDEWATGGRGRALAWRAGEEVGDMAAEISDWITNTDFSQFDERYMDIWQRKRHRRRLRRHGLMPKWREPSGYKARFPEWLATQAAMESAQGLGLDEDEETMSADEVVR